MLRHRQILLVVTSDARVLFLLAATNNPHRNEFRRVELILFDKFLAAVERVSKRLREVERVIPELLGAISRNLSPLQVAARVTAVAGATICDRGRSAEQREDATLWIADVNLLVA
jgi:hypothetical protein